MGNLYARWNSRGECSDSCLEGKNNDSGIEIKQCKGDKDKKRKRNDEEQQKKVQNCSNKIDKELDSKKKPRKKHEPQLQSQDTSDGKIDDRIVTGTEPKLNLPHDGVGLLSLKCGWVKCKHEDTNMDSFAKHVNLHEPHPVIWSNTIGRHLYHACLWHLCSFSTRDSNAFDRHLAYHSYHTILKSIGENVMRHNHLPKCKYSRNKRNNVPELLRQFTCFWEGCNFTYNDPLSFVYHIEGHINQQQGEKDIYCRWGNCTKKFNTITKLQEHVRTHTQEKTVSCPNCGSLFEFSLEFIKHLITGPAPANMGYFVCHSCPEMHRTRPQLWRHILKSHPTIYQCGECKYKTHTPWALEMHLESHLSGKWFPDDKRETVAPHVLHPKIPFDDGLEWAWGEDSDLKQPVKEPSERAGVITTLLSLPVRVKDFWADASGHIAVTLHSLQQKALALAANLAAIAEDTVGFLGSLSRKIVDPGMNC